MAQDCDCGNSRCPRSPNYEPPCAHCMCLAVPETISGQWQVSSGPVGQKCCRCGEFRADMRRWMQHSQTQTYTATPGRLEVTV